MKLKQLKDEFAVCKLESADSVDFNKEYVFLARTDEEISLVCKAADLPDNATHIEAGWKGLKICGILDFGMIGVIAEISNLLAQNKISIFVISTYNTDYIFLKFGYYDHAIRILSENGYKVI